MKQCLFSLIFLNLILLSGCNSKFFSDKDFVLVEGDENIADFYMEKIETTQDIYSKVMGENPSYHKGNKLPVENISYYDVIYFCNKLSQMCNLEPCYYVNGSSDIGTWNYIPHSGFSINATKEDIVCDSSANGYRLPFQKEWSYAAKGGKNKDPFVFSGSDIADEVAWYYVNTKTSQKGGLKKPNSLGLYDMSGNVWEWLCDSYLGGSSDQRRFYGGCYLNIPTYLKVDISPHIVAAKGAYMGLGFRLVKSKK